MYIPTFSSVAEGLVFMVTKIMNATSHWQRYGDAASAAYSWAWHHQEAVLKEVSERIERRLKAEEAAAEFAFTLLTVGVGGALAGKFVKEAFEGTGVKDYLVDAAVDLAKEKVKDIKPAYNWAAKQLGTVGETPSPDAFKPPGVTPDEYGPTLLEGIMQQTTELTDMLDALQSSRDAITLQGVQNLAQVICKSAFVSQPPNPALTKQFLKPKALLSLWLAWAWGRDVNYWETHSMAAIYGNEDSDFNPVREDLFKFAGVSEALITQQAMIKTKGLPTYGDVMNMDAFLKWANSFAVIPLLLQGSGAPGQMQMRIQQQLMMKRMMPWYHVDVAA
jgi:hypothetical protein